MTGFFAILIILVCGNFCSAQNQDIIISELAWMGTEVSGNDEWIELENLSDQDIDLSGWSLMSQDGSPVINLEGIITIDGLFLLERSDDDTVPDKQADLIYSGAISNDGEALELYNSDEEIVDLVDCGEEWFAGDNNTKKTMEKVGSIWQTSCDIGGTPGEKNIYCSQSDDNSEDNDSNNDNQIVDSHNSSDTFAETLINKYDDSGYIIISEIFPDPLGSDEDDEWIEIYNKGGKVVNLLGWQLGDNTQKRYEFGNIELRPQKYLVLKRDKTGIALNNKKDSVKLFKPLTDLPWQIVTFENAITGWSYAWDKNKVNNSWVWSAICTPGEKNEIEEMNGLPVVDLEYPQQVKAGDYVWFDASDTVDPDGDELQFLWNMGDGHMMEGMRFGFGYIIPGDYNIILLVSDGKDEVIIERKIEVQSNIVIVKGVNNFDENLATTTSNIIINEFMPNPLGSDNEGEWIEVRNTGNSKINLLNWSIDDGEAGSRPYNIGEDVWLDAGDFFLFDRVESNIALNNSSDSVRVFDAQDNLIDEVAYKKSKEDKSYVRLSDDSWVWSGVVSPGEENLVQSRKSKVESNNVEIHPSYEASTDVENSKFKIDNDSSTNKFQISNTKPKISAVYLSDLSRLNSEEYITTRGTVLVEPGVLATQYFYISDGVGAQVYNYNKDFPDLVRGDIIEVSGSFSTISDEFRIKTKFAGDMRVIDHVDEVDVVLLHCDDISDEFLGKLIEVEGDIVEKNNTTVFLDDDTDELRVYVKATTGIDMNGIGEGNKFRIRGILGKTKSGFRLMPRDGQDIYQIGEEINLGEQVLGEVVTSSEWRLEGHDSGRDKFWYMIISFFTIGGLVVWGLWKLKDR